MPARSAITIQLCRFCHGFARPRSVRRSETGWVGSIAPRWDLHLTRACRWRMVYGRPLTVGDVVLHHDAGPGTTIVRPFGGLSVIDRVFCAPGAPVADLAFSAWRWIPLWADREAVAGRCPPPAALAPRPGSGAAWS